MKLTAEHAAACLAGAERRRVLTPGRRRPYARIDQVRQRDAAESHAEAIQQRAARQPGHRQRARAFVAAHNRSCFFRRTVCCKNVGVNFQLPTSNSQLPTPKPGESKGIWVKAGSNDPLGIGSWETGVDVGRREWMLGVGSWRLGVDTGTGVTSGR